MGNLRNLQSSEVNLNIYEKDWVENFARNFSLSLRVINKTGNLVNDRHAIQNRGRGKVSDAPGRKDSHESEKVARLVETAISQLFSSSVLFPVFPSHRILPFPGYTWKLDTTFCFAERPNIGANLLAFSKLFFSRRRNPDYSLAECKQQSSRVSVPLSSGDSSLPLRPSPFVSNLNH